MCALILLAFLTLLCVQALFLLWGARIAGVEGPTFGKAFVTVIVSGVTAAIVTSAIDALSLPIGAGGALEAVDVKDALGGLVTFLIETLFAMALFATTFGRAFVAVAMAWFFLILVLGGIVLAVLLATGALLPLG